MNKPNIRCPDKKTLLLRTLFCILGNAIIGLGVAMSKTADFGIDPFNGMCMSVSAFFDINYMLYTWTFNLCCFVFEILWGRHYIHIGTFINWFLVSYAVTFFLNLSGPVSIPHPETVPGRIVLLVLSLLVISFGLAVYQIADLGIAPYDAIPFMFCERHPNFPYFWARIILDSACVTGILLTHGDLLGVGTLLTALGLGPVVHLFMVLLKKLVSAFHGSEKKTA